MTKDNSFSYGNAKINSYICNLKITEMYSLL